MDHDGHLVMHLEEYPWIGMGVSKSHSQAEPAPQGAWEFPGKDLGLPPFLSSESSGQSTQAGSPPPARHTGQASDPGQSKRVMLGSPPFCLSCSMEGGELFSRIQERGDQAFTERGLCGPWGQ